MDVRTETWQGQSIYKLTPNGTQSGMEGAIIDMDGVFLSGDRSVLESGIVDVLHYAEPSFWELGTISGYNPLVE